MIFDFTTNSEGLNFSVMEPSEWQMHRKSIDGVEQSPVEVFPYPERYGGTISDNVRFTSSADDANMMAFGFDHS